jgi:hypothetical protein
MIGLPPTIEVLVSPTGQSTVRTAGFAGAGCREASRFLEQALGQVTAEQLTAEFHQRQDLRQHEQNPQQG